jgi:hypothetical protein
VRCFAATCAAASKCCCEQPPQTPKCGQRGSTRAALDLSTASTRAKSNVGFLFCVVIATTSPGSAPSTKTALPSMRAMPRPSWSSDAIFATTGAGATREPVASAGADRVDISQRL